MTATIMQETTGLGEDIKASTNSDFNEYEGVPVTSIQINQTLIKTDRDKSVGKKF